MIKNFTLLLCFAYLMQVNAFEKIDLLRSLDSVTDELLRAQNELGIAHEFSEMQIYINRNIVSSYIELMNEALLGSFMNTHREMIVIEDSVRNSLEEHPANDCTDRVRIRFNLQVIRHGHFLSSCMRESHRELEGWLLHTNEINDQAQLTLNQAQNQGLAAISERQPIDSPDSFYSPINRRLRLLLTSVRSYMDQFEEFRWGLVDNEDEIIDELTRCDRELVDSFRRVAEQELSRIEFC